MQKKILITGSTDGIGRLTTMKLAADGHTLIMHGRNPEKLEKLKEGILSQYPSVIVSTCVADFADLKAVKAMGEQLLTEIDHIDVLINNAGVFKSSQATTAEGYDLRMAVNYLAPYLLTKTLLPLLLKSQAPRLINLSSAAQASVDLDFLSGTRTVSVNEAYAQSKLALTMWSFDLAQKESKLNVIAVNPGSLLNTRMVQEAYGQHWAPADKGANILYRLATMSEYADKSGEYFDNDKGEQIGRFAQAHADAYDEILIQQLVDKTDILLQ